LKTVRHEQPAHDQTGRDIGRREPTSRLDAADHLDLRNLQNVPVNGLPSGELLADGPAGQRAGTASSSSARPLALPTSSEEALVWWEPS
jgi:hypothetical protein